MGRIVVITGGTSGIGLGLKELFEKNGDTVITFSTRELDDVNHYSGSVSHEIKVRQVFNDIHERYGKIDMLINCAGIGMSAITEYAPLEDINNVMDVNFYGTLYCCRAALGYMDAGSRIVNISSAMALYPVPFRSIYGASKAAVLNLSMGLRMELLSAGIDVTAICPGDTKTNFTANRIKDYSSSERYGERLATATESSDARENKRMPVEKVAENIYKLINKKKTKPFYIVGGKYKFLYFLTRLTPKSMLINKTAKKLGGVMERPVSKKQKQAKAEVVVEAKADEVVEAKPVQNEPEDVKVEEGAPVVAETDNEETSEVKENSIDIAEAKSVDNSDEEKSEGKSADNADEEKSEEKPSTEEEKKSTLNSLLSKITIVNKKDDESKED